MKVYEIRPDKGCNAHTEKSLTDALIAINQWLVDSEEGTEVTVTIKEMSEKDYDNLPEYDGP